MARILSTFEGAILRKCEDPYTAKTGETRRGLTVWMLPDEDGYPPVEFAFQDDQAKLWNDLGVGERVKFAAGDPYYKGGPRPVAHAQPSIPTGSAPKAA